MNTRKVKTMYVLVRRDLADVYRCVQGGHALSAYSLRGDLKAYEDWNNSKLIYLSVPNEAVLKFWSQKLTDKNKRWIGFNEPDLHNQLTAIACIDTGEVFKKLPLA